MSAPEYSLVTADRLLYEVESTLRQHATDAGLSFARAWDAGWRGESPHSRSYRIGNEPVWVEVVRDSVRCWQVWYSVAGVLPTEAAFKDAELADACQRIGADIVDALYELIA